MRLIKSILQNLTIEKRNNIQNRYEWNVEEKLLECIRGITGDENTLTDGRKMKRSFLKQKQKVKKGRKKIEQTHK